MDNPDNNVLAGDLKYLGLGDIIQLLGANGSTGVLRLSNRYVPEPAFVYFKQGNPVNALYDEKSGIDALLALFGWIEGDFEFIQQKITAQIVIKKSRMGIILDEGLFNENGNSFIVQTTLSIKVKDVSFKEALWLIYCKTNLYPRVDEHAVVISSKKKLGF